METVVLYVHGLWMTGIEGGVLRRRMATLMDADVPRFSYSSVRLGIADNAARLAFFLQQIRAGALHLIGHSLGGVVIYEALKMLDHARLPPGRVVLLGSPIAGSRAAVALDRRRVGRSLLGRTVRETLIVASKRRWPDASREVGIIAGTRNIGLGRLVSRHVAPSDGTVYVDETHIDGAKAHLALHVSHMGLPFSLEVARSAARFLKSGSFNG